MEGLKHRLCQRVKRCTRVCVVHVRNIGEILAPENTSFPPKSQSSVTNFRKNTNFYNRNEYENNPYFSLYTNI